MWLPSIINNIRSAISNNRITIFDSTEINKPHSIEVLKHSKNYSKLLDVYVISTKRNITMKNWFKILFFIITMGSMLAIVYLFYVSLQYAFDNFAKFDNLNEISIEAILSIVTIIFPSISSLIVAFIKIPEIIAHYLFNVEEDNYMNSVIKNIQDYDKSMFAMEHKIDEMLMDNKDQEPSSEDESIEDSPIEDVG